MLWKIDILKIFNFAFHWVRWLSKKIEKAKIKKKEGLINKHLHAINDITQNAIDEFTKKEMNLKKIEKLMNYIRQKKFN